MCSSDLPQDKPKEVRVWHATNPNARDFRLETLGPVWTSEVLSADASGDYVGRVTAPAKGWSAFLVELKYDIGAPVPLKLTTDVTVVPDVLPFGPFRPKLPVAAK